ncbi:MAG TPA: hypothetical protein VEU30_00890, partial [Thermoanaerobaculia bacterium]|nr:hypothetical protein [Thermoanaerobaculia bacterium]
MKRFFLVPVVFLVAVSLSAQTVEVAPSTPAALALRAHLDANVTDVTIRNTYAPIGYRLIWSTNGHPTPQAFAAIALFRAADAKALDPKRYDFVANDPVAFDVNMTASLIRYASDLRIGRVNPTVQFQLDADAKQVYLPDVVIRAAEASDVAAVIAELEPRHDDYQRLAASLATWRRIAAESANDVPLPTVTKLVPGNSYDALPQLAERLRRYGDLTT